MNKKNNQSNQREKPRELLEKYREKQGKMRSEYKKVYGDLRERQKRISAAKKELSLLQAKISNMEEIINELVGEFDINLTQEEENNG